MSNAKTITSQLWEMANKLRGTMDASEYKNYILPFMFYKYLSERQNEYLEENSLTEFNDFKSDNPEIQDYVKDISDGLGYAINPQHTWSTLIEKITNHKIVASDIQSLFEDFKSNAQLNPSSGEDFSDVFADVNIGDSRLGGSTNERAQALYDIILMIDSITYKNDRGQDVLGDVYEYLIGQFAASAGKKGGEFYTPHEVSKVLAKLVTIDAKVTGDQFTVYDPTMGSGSLLLTVRKELPHKGDVEVVDFYGQELNTTTYNLARMNLMMHGVDYKNMNLRRGDTLDLDWPFQTKDGIERPRKFDAVVANPPYSQKWDQANAKDPRFYAGLAPKSKADYAFVQHGLYHLDSKGTMAIVLPHGVLFRGASEGRIREQLIKDNMLDAVIGLPANLFYGTSIPTCILVFKGKAARHTKDILFIDASQEFDKVKNQNRLTDGNIDKIIDTYKNRKTTEKYSYLATLEEIEENDYNLNIPRYVDTFEEEVVIPLDEILKEMKETQSDINEANASLLEMMQELTSEDKAVESQLKDFIDWMKQM